MEITLTYSFEEYGRQHSEGEEFETFTAALQRFDSWEVDDPNYSKRISVNVYVDGDILGSWELLTDDLYMSITEAAEVLGVTRQRVFAMLQADVLSGHKIGGTWAVSKASVEKRLGV